METDLLVKEKNKQKSEISSPTHVNALTNQMSQTFDITLTNYVQWTLVIVNP